MAQDGYSRRRVQTGSPRLAPTPPLSPSDAEQYTGGLAHLTASTSDRIVYPGIPLEYQPLRWSSPQEEVALKLQEIRQVYAGSVHIAYDRFIYHQDCQAIYVRFAACSAPSPRHAGLALGMMAHKIGMLLQNLHWRAAPIILDTADLVIGQAAVTAWEQGLQDLLDRVCLVAPAGSMLYAQFNSHRRPDDVDAIVNAVRRIQLLGPHVKRPKRSSTFSGPRRSSRTRPFASRPTRTCPRIDLAA